MKKQVLFSILTAIIALPGFAQDNKPVKGDIGLRFGLTFNGNVGQQVVLSGMISDRSEIGSIISVGVVSAKTEDIDSVQVNTSAPGSVTGIRHDIEKASSTNILINPFYAYHFPVPSNVDVYLGVNAGVGVGIPGAQQSITKTMALNYEQVSTDKDKLPATLFVNGGIMVGCQYFFYKKLAIGAVASLGLSYGSQKGKVKSSSEVVNTGTDNNGTDSFSEGFYRVNNSSFSLATSSYVGINLAFYFGKSAK